ncbi:uncharacterized protein LOC113272767 [Papaver somniferum]|uniref:uncharacterized protein LOC113272767 n=1 Tax=Papaver somniferum TaxID=3469 RepID=UPI000E6FC571|nr:uncharacterized protein LOC113272767 [Papaver somniferum]
MKKKMKKVRVLSIGDNCRLNLESVGGGGKCGGSCRGGGGGDVLYQQQLWILVLVKPYFERKEDRDRILNVEAWMFDQQKLNLMEWFPGFDADKHNTSNATVWVKFPSLPVEFWIEKTLLAFDIDGIHVTVGGRDFLQPIEIQNIPKFCTKCKIIGHIDSECRKKHKNTTGNAQQHHNSGQLQIADNIQQVSQEEVTKSEAVFRSAYVELERTKHKAAAYAALVSGATGSMPNSKSVMNSETWESRNSLDDRTVVNSSDTPLNDALYARETIVSPNQFDVLNAELGLLDDTILGDGSIHFFDALSGKWTSKTPVILARNTSGPGLPSASRITGNSNIGSKSDQNLEKGVKAATYKTKSVDGTPKKDAGRSAQRVKLSNTNFLAITIGIDGVMFSLVHASSVQVTRRDLWRQLNLGDQQVPWLVIGDFNCVLRNEEKKGGASPNTAVVNEFSDWIYDNNLFEFIESLGCNFTWSNRQSGVRRTINKLDRVVINEFWLNRFGNWRSKALPREVSDHSPLIGYTFVNSRTKRSPFRVQKMWFSHPDFIRMVQDSWNAPLEGSPAYVFAQKLKSLKGDTKVWNQQVFGNVYVRFKQAQLRLENSLRIAHEDPFDLHKNNTMKEASVKVNNICMQWATMLNQKSRNQWLVEGESNTSFFHNSIRNRRSINTISELVDDHGQAITYCDQIKDLAVNYFINKFNGDVCPGRFYI